eukprot:8445285-Pyramimonas_sp.AAC.1
MVPESRYGISVWSLRGTILGGGNTQVLVSYGCSEYSNARMLTQYGFVRPTNPYDTLDWASVETVEAPLIVGLGEEEEDEGKEEEEEEELEQEDQLPLLSMELLERALQGAQEVFFIARHDTILH